MKNKIITASIILIVSIQILLFAVFLSGKFAPKYEFGIIKITRNHLIVDNVAICPIIINPKDGYSDYPDSIYPHSRFESSDYYIPKIDSMMKFDLNINPAIVPELSADSSLPFVMIPPVIRSLKRAGFNSVCFKSFAGNKQILKIIQSEYSLDDSTLGIRIKLSPDSATLVYGYLNRFNAFYEKELFTCHGSCVHFWDSATLQMDKNSITTRMTDSTIWLDVHPKTSMAKFEQLLKNTNIPISRNYNLGIRMPNYPSKGVLFCCNTPGNLKLRARN